MSSLVVIEQIAENLPNLELFHNLSFPRPLCRLWLCRRRLHLLTSGAIIPAHSHSIDPLFGGAHDPRLVNVPLADSLEPGNPQFDVVAVSVVHRRIFELAPVLSPCSAVKADSGHK